LKRSFSVGDVLKWWNVFKGGMEAKVLEKEKLRNL